MASLVQKIIHMLRSAVGCSEYSSSRLDEIVAAANDFTTTSGGIADWIQLLESRKIRENSREGMIQVMTIHKSKGLGFDVVILPELGGQGFAPTNRLEILERKGQLGSTDYIIRKPAKEICAADSALQNMLGSWEAEQCYERFCNLYVALTRAKHASYCIIDPVYERWKPRSKFDDWIRESTARDGIGEKEVSGEVYSVLYEAGNWLDLSQNRESVSVTVKNIKELKKAKPRVARKIASAQKELPVGSSLVGNKGAVFGNLVHQHFEKITWLDELPDLGQQVGAVTVLECLKIPEISAFFNRPSGDCQLLREQPFETQVQGAWLSGVIDRVVITLEKGKAKQVSIIDFKTDQKDALELRELYAGQLEVYRQAMARITGVSEKHISCHILATHLKQMLEM